MALVLVSRVRITKGILKPLSDSVHPSPMDVQLATEAELESPQQASGLQFLAAGDDAFQGLIRAQPQRARLCSGVC